VVKIKGIVYGKYKGSKSINSTVSTSTIMVKQDSATKIIQ
jgi:hypothetical protein